jgi:ATP-dependent DNA ligase
MKYPLRQRKEILSKIVKERPGILEIVKFQEIYLYDEIVKRFSESIDRNE